jgi:hypothetical protein
MSLHCDNAQRLEFSSSINPYGLTFAELLSLGALAFRAMALRAFPKRTFGILDGAVRRNSSRRAVMLASFRRYPFCFPKGQLTSGPVSRPTDCSSGYVVSRIVIFGPRSSRDVRTAARQTSHYNFRPSLTKRLELLRQNKACAVPLRASEQYRERAEVYRLEAESFRDPKVHEQMHRLAAICEREARKAEEF